jgi:hypothetical protein
MQLLIIINSLNPIVVGILDMRSIINDLLWAPKHLYFAHYVIVVNLITPRSRLEEIERRCDAMDVRLFGEQTTK